MPEAQKSSSFIVHRSSLTELLLALADDEFVTGYANSEWTGIAPVLEEDIAFSSLAQDELGHARLLYELLAELQRSGVGGQGSEGSDSLIPEARSPTPDEIAYGRPPPGFRNAQLAERPRGDWAYSVSRQFLYDTADYIRLDSLRRSSYAPLATAAGSIIREEKYHLLHGQTWLERLARAGEEARRRQREAFESLWPDALGLFEPLAGEAELLAAGALPDSFGALEQRWLSSIAAPLRQLDLPFPFDESPAGWRARVSPRYGGRRGEHSASFLELHDNITSVYRLDPSAKW
ncbi:MAG: phenylacetate-CoA oxygenase subunit PaaI [Kouleothrix sp.]|nr:phenylacetate-CoA oxygenase subunit PaaI [Kouleothrix sp.]